MIGLVIRVVENDTMRALLGWSLLTAVSAASVTMAADEPLSDVIDRHIQQAWKTNSITPAPPASDAAFLRRVYLDLTGTIPSYDEAVAFLNDDAADKRSRLIQRLLDHPRYALHQADVWDMVYFGRNPPGFGTRDRDGFKKWLRTQFAKNVPYNVWTAEILRAEGNTVENGAPMFFVQYKNAPEDATEAVTRRFLGVQLQCARCHDHPFDEWSQLDFYGMAAFFARLEIVDVGNKNKQKAFAIGEKNRGEVLFTGPVTEDEPGKKGEPVFAKFLHGEKLDEPELPKDLQDPRNFPSGKMPPPPKFSRKDKIAEWITRPDNPYFARAAANRIWAQFMGKGIVHPVDNLSPQNPPSHPELLDALTTSLVQHDFDLKWFIGQIASSKTYQLSAEKTSTEAKPIWYQRARFRPLSAEELLESWLIATGLQDALAAKGTPHLAVAKDGSTTERMKIRGFTWDYMRRAFGHPEDGTGNFQGGMQEHLYMNNGQVRQLISTEKGTLHNTLSVSDQPWEQRVERLFLQTLSRPPSDEESKRFVTVLTEAKPNELRDRLHDSIWALVTCSEFRFNH